MAADEVDIPTYVRLLWHGDEDVRPGPRRSLDVREIGAAGVQLADEGGAGAVSMRAVATAVGLTPMALYRYVASKRELMLMVLDAAYGPVPTIRGGRRGWRPQLDDWATALRLQLTRHPWVVAVPVGEPPLLPNSVAWMERALAAMAQTPMTERQKMSSLLLLDVYVRGQVAVSHGLGEPDAQPDQDAGRLYTGRLLALADDDAHPHVRQALGAGALEDDNDFATDEFTFGLKTVLDGIAPLATKGPTRR